MKENCWICLACSTRSDWSSTSTGSETTCSCTTESTRTNSNTNTRTCSQSKEYRCSNWTLSRRTQVNSFSFQSHHSQLFSQWSNRRSWCRCSNRCISRSTTFTIIHSTIYWKRYCNTNWTRRCKSIWNIFSSNGFLSFSYSISISKWNQLSKP